MAETALKELNEQIKLVRQEAYAAGFSAAMREDRDTCRKTGSERTSVEAVSTRGTGASGAGTVATSGGGLRLLKCQKNVDRRQHRDALAEQTPKWWSRCYRPMRRVRCAPSRSAVRSSATRAPRLPSARSARRSTSWRHARLLSRSTRRPGVTTWALALRFERIRRRPVGADARRRPPGAAISLPADLPGLPAGCCVTPWSSPLRLRAVTLRSQHLPPPGTQAMRAPPRETANIRPEPDDK